MSSSTKLAKKIKTTKMSGNGYLISVGMNGATIANDIKQIIPTKKVL